MDNPFVILVDSEDNRIGVEEKIRAHRDLGMLHRAVSVLVFRTSNGHMETLLQKRSDKKPLWPGFWTNTVCTHPFENESYNDAGARRLYEEMGIKAPAKDFVYGFRFEYQAQFSDKFSEHELDTVLFLLWDGTPKPDPKEADDVKWVAWDELVKEIQEHPAAYTPWFKEIVENKKTKECIDRL
jgi:isopentenyl-diphosphate Delta-isomerase